MAAEAAWLNGNNREKRRNEDEERKNARKGLTLTGLLMKGMLKPVRPSRPW
jgi:hypothetical protein